MVCSCTYSGVHAWQAFYSDAAIPNGVWSWDGFNDWWVPPLLSAQRIEESGHNEMYPTYEPEDPKTKCVHTERVGSLSR